MGSERPLRLFHAETGEPPVHYTCLLTKNVGKQLLEFVRIGQSDVRLIVYCDNVSSVFEDKRSVGFFPFE